MAAKEDDVGKHDGQRPQGGQMTKVVFTTTLKAIRKRGPCKDGWKKLLAHLGKKKADDEPINLLTILESNGVQDMLWALRCVGHPDRNKVARLMACDFAESVLPIFEAKYPDDPRPRECIKVARMYTRGKADDRQIAAARAAAAAEAAALDAARNAALAAAAAEAAAWDALDAAWAAARAAAGDAAEAAAWAAALDAEQKKQETIIRKYLRGHVK